MADVILVACGTRPELIRLAPTLLRLSEIYDLRILWTGQNSHKRLSSIFIEELGLDELNWIMPDDNLLPMSAGQVPFVASVVSKVNELIERFRPSLFLVLGDTFSCLGALAAYLSDIRILHLESGNRCFDSSVPEEKNRVLIDRISFAHVVYSERARLNLIDEGIDRDKVFVFGSPLAETYEGILKKNPIPLFDTKLAAVVDRKFVLVSLHRFENTSEPDFVQSQLKEIDEFCGSFGLQCVLTAHPSMIQRTGLSVNDFVNVHFFEPFGLIDYLHLQRLAEFVVSDSGSVHEDALILGIKAINLRRRHERQEISDLQATLHVATLDQEVLKRYYELDFDIEALSDGSNLYSRGRDFSRRVAMLIFTILGDRH